jgi:ferredoxin-like protein FixX
MRLYKDEENHFCKYETHKHVPSGTFHELKTMCKEKYGVSLS